MKNMTCKYIEIIIREVESASPAVLANMKKRHWAYRMDGFLRSALLYGGRRGIVDAVDFANEKSGIIYEIDDVLHELHLCEQDCVRVLKNGVVLWILYYCLFVERMEKVEKEKYYASWKMMISAWIAWKLANWYKRRNT